MNKWAFFFYWFAGYLSRYHLANAGFPALHANPGSGSF